MYAGRWWRDLQKILHHHAYKAVDSIPKLKGSPKAKLKQ